MSETSPSETTAPAESGVGTLADFPGSVKVGDGDPAETSAGDPNDFPGSVKVPDVAAESGGAALAGGVKGFTEGTGMTGGGVTGFKLGMKLPIPHPIAKAAAVAVTTIGGALYGAFAGHKAVDGLSKVTLPSGSPLTYTNLDEVPPHLRSSFVFGENVGAGVSFMGPQVLAAKLGAKTLSTSFAGNVFNGIMSDARNKTGRFLFGQAASSIGAGMGGAASEEIAPGELGPRIGSEVVGGILAPGQIILKTGSYIFGRFANMRQAFSPAARETAAAKLIQDAYLTSGDDIEVAAKILRSSIENDPNITATVAQRIGDDAMIGLEKALISESHKVSLEAGRRAEATLSLFRDSIKVLRGSGNPEAMREAAEIERRFFTSLLADRLNTVKVRASEAAGELLTKGKDTRTAVSLQAYQAAEDALLQAREIEHGFWELVPKDLPATTRSIQVAYKAMKARMLNNQPMPRVLLAELNDFEKSGGITNVGYLKIFRSNMLRMAREAGSNPERATEAGMYGHIAEAALDDIDVVFKNPATAGVLRTMGFDPQAYDTARSFSAALHATFTNSFTGKNLAQGSSGLRLAPEALMKRAFAGGAEVTEYRLAELAESTRFLPKQGLGGVEAEKNAALMLAAQEEYFAIAAAEVAGIKKGPARVEAIRTFVSKNPELKERFPEVVGLLENAANTQAGVDSVAALNKSSGAIMEQQTAWGKLAGNKRGVFESPVDAVSSGLSGPAPVRSLTAMAKLAVRYDAVPGFRATVFEHATREASNVDGVLDFQKLRRSLLEPIRPGKPSVIKVMQETGAFDDESVKALTTILDKADTLVRSQATTGIFVDTQGTVDFLTQAIAKIIGSKLATTAAGAPGGSSIIVAAAGARFGDRIINAIPAGKTKALLIEATQNPELMLLLMEKPVGEAKVLSHGLKLHSMLVGLGIIPVTPLMLGAEDLATDVVDMEDVSEPLEAAPEATLEAVAPEEVVPEAVPSAIGAR